ncbi:MAG: hypothetical protein LUF85_16640 [Bacteroides sp.]|nr:hypothetical protein [Bacteroides sp.]
MDYKDIEQLLERYWQCDTTLEEEGCLRDFFLKTDVPVHLRKYRELFVYQYTQQQEGLSQEFDARILQQIGEPIVVKARRISWRQLYMPLFRAAMIVGFVWTLGTAVRYTFWSDESVDYDYDAYIDTYDDPAMAYEEVTNALWVLSEKLSISLDTEFEDTLSVIRDHKLREE